MSAVSIPLYQSKLTFPSPNRNTTTPPSSFPSSFSTNKLLSSSTSSPIPILYTTSHLHLPALAACTNQSLSTTTIETNNDLNTTDTPHTTAIVIHARNQIGLLQSITRVFNIFGLHIEKATYEFGAEDGDHGNGNYITRTFHVTDSRGNRIEDVQNLEKIKKALTDEIDGGDKQVKVVGSTGSTTGRGVVVRKLGGGERKGKVERMFGLMDRFLKSDPISLQRDILDHVEYTVARSRFSFDDFEAYQVIIY